MKDFSEEVKINRFKLPEECENHSSKYYYWAKLLANAKTELGSNEDKLKLTSAERELFIRNHWDDSNGKQTEAGVKAILETDKEVIAAKKTLMSNQSEVNTLFAAVTAMEHRRDMLKCEKELLIGGFYASPDGGGRKEGPVEQASNIVRSKLNKDKKK